jgi:hypothetical protein
MNISTATPKFRAQRIQNNTQVPTMGCIYTGDTGNSNWVSGVLMQVDGLDATIVDARGKSHMVISTTLRSLQATR